MKIVVAGEDRSAELGPVLRAEAAAHEADPSWHPLPAELQAPGLRGARTEQEFETRFFELARRKNHVGTEPFDIPHRPGALGALSARIKQVLWKVFRYQHDRMAFHQNMINSHLTNALEFERDALRREVARLEARMAELERRLDEVRRAR
jgi:hypothetical protein